MRHLTFLTLIMAMGISMPAKAGENQVSVNTIGDGTRKVSVTAVTEDIIRVTNTAEGEETAVSKTLLPITEDARAEVFDAPASKVVATPSGIIASVDNATGAVTISAPNGIVISDSGERKGADGKETITLLTQGGESFYGAGERGYSLNLAGDTLVMFNKQNYGYTAGEARIKQMNITMPLLISSKGYAIVFDDYAAATLTTSNPLTYTSEAGRPIAYYFISGVTGKDRKARIDNVLKRLTRLTGRQDLPPLWSLGYITSKYGYHTEAETRGVVDTLQRAGYPVDGIVLDLYWYGKEQDMGRLEWDKDQWPTPVKMLSDLKKKGVNLVAISQPYVLRNGRAIDNYNELAPKGYFVRDAQGNPGEVTIWVGHGGMFDVSNPSTCEWLAERYHQLTEMGVGGWWGDLGEPEVHPDSLYHYNGLKARQYHNLYGSAWSKIIYDMFKKEYPERRLMTMMRGGTIGLQRYSVFPWSTDVSRSWGGLQPQVTIMLNSGLSGMGYMSHDVGGFAINPENPVDAELYVRWLQLGTFSPILRTHSQHDAEPYKYPEHQDIILPLIKERYAWLPYNYTLAYENAHGGEPLVRPLNYYNSANTTLDGITDEYLWGRDILVAPVLTQGTTQRDVTFPEGEWMDISNPGKIYHGGETISYPTPLAVLPKFVRAGSFIAKADYAMKNVGDYRTDRYTVNYYPTAGKTTGYIYEDDMSTPSTLAEGRYTLLRFAGDASESTIAVDLKAEKGIWSYANPEPVKQLTMEVYNVASRPSAVTYNGRKAAYKYDATAKRVTIKLKWDTGIEGRLVITK